MFRDKLARLQDTLSTTAKADLIIFCIVLGLMLTMLIGAINLLPLATLAKSLLFIPLSLLITGIGLKVLYNQNVMYKYGTNDKNESDNEAFSSSRDIPPMPATLPTISAEKSATPDSIEEFEISDDDVVTAKKEENPSLYRHSFSIKPVIFKIVLVLVLWSCLLIIAIMQNNSALWWILGGASILTPIYCYYLVLRWKGEEFVVNDMWYERPLTMPFPFPSHTPAIRRSEIGKYEFKQTALDKLIGTCRLYSDTPSPDDKSFHNVKWLTHPAELRRATGISAPRKNSWLSPFRKNKT